MLVLITGGVFALLGAVILGLAAYLMTQGGSLFYIVMGAGVIVSGVLLMRRKRAGLTVYATTLLLTLAWSLWEVGIDKWQMIPRGGLLAALGLWLTLPVVTRGLRTPGISEPATLWRGSHGFLSATMGVLIAFTIGMCFYDPFTVEGSLPLAQADNAAPAVPGTVAPPADDWRAYGGNNLGQRYTSLKDINVDSVKKL